MKSNIFDVPCQVLVNPVNTVGVMGKGLALEFKLNYPLYFQDYNNKCAVGNILLGFVDFYYINTNLVVCSFPTKRHWQTNSRLDFIIAGLQDLNRKARLFSNKTIAVPKLGCGNGNLSYKDVEPLIDTYLPDWKVTKV